MHAGTGAQVVAMLVMKRMAIIAAEAILLPKVYANDRELPKYQSDIACACGDQATNGGVATACLRTTRAENSATLAGPRSGSGRSEPGGDL